MPLSYTSHSNPIFVVGSVHSGTTLLRRIFDKYSTLYVVAGETQLYQNLPLHRRRFPNLDDDSMLKEYITHVAKVARTSFGRVHNRSDASTKLEEFGLTPDNIEQIFEDAKHVRNHLKLIGLVFDHITRITGKERWMEKTPSHLLHIDKILHAIPEAQIIELVRDPRDVLASKNSRQSKEWIEKRIKMFPAREKYLPYQVGYDSFWDSLTWKSAIQMGNQAKSKYPQNILRVRYEDLVTHPEKEVSRICDFLNLSYYPELLDVAWQNNTTKIAKENVQGIGTTSIGKGVRMLPLADIAICQRLTKSEMNTLNYEPAPITFNARLKIPFSLLKSGYELFARLYRRWRLGGFVYVKKIFMNAGLTRLRNLIRSG